MNLLHAPIQKTRYSAAVLLYAALGACSAEPASAPHDQLVNELNVSSDKVFGPEERRIAGALSLGNNSALEDTDDPYQKALICGVGMRQLAERMQPSGALNEAQAEVFTSMIDTYEREAMEAGGKTPAELARDQREWASKQDDSSRVARAGLACLEKLMPAS